MADETLIDQIIRDTQAMLRAGEIPSPLPGHEYGAPSHTAFCRHNSPMEITVRVIDDAARETFRALQERSRLPS